MKTDTKQRSLLAKEREPGQAILLVALIMVILLGFTGLAVDGGNLYFTQRQAQNAVDAALLAAINEMCTNTVATSSSIETAALNAATLNNFPNSPPTTTVTVNSPPLEGGAAGNSDYVEVIVYADAPTYLIQMVYNGPTEVRVRGVGQCRPEQVAFPSYALIALGTGSSCPHEGIQFGGTGDMTVTGAGIHSNYGGACPATTSCAAASSQGSSSITIDPSYELSTVGCINDSGGITATTAQNQPVVPDPLAAMDPPNDNCGGAAVDPGTDADGILDSGHYTDLSGTYTLNPGIYCVECGGGSGNCNAIKLTSDSLTGSGVVIYVKWGDVEISGNGTHNLTGPSHNSLDPGYCVPTGTCDWAGMLLYVDRNNTAGSQVVSMGGGASSYYRGTIYAPSHYCTVAGNSYTSAFNAQFACDQVEVTGTGNVDIVYSSSDVFWIPPQLTVNE